VIVVVITASYPTLSGSLVLNEILTAVGGGGAPSAAVGAGVAGTGVAVGSGVRLGVGATLGLDDGTALGEGVGTTATGDALGATVAAWHAARTTTAMGNRMARRRGTDPSILANRSPTRYRMLAVS
jgi:hypothetical protein